MKRYLFIFAVTALLTACALKIVEPRGYNNPYEITKLPIIVVEKVVEKEVVKTTPSPTIVQGNARIRSGCKEYVPLPLPHPAKIDFRELEKATSSQEVNAVVLKNVKEMRQQMLTYASDQKKHYAAYVSRCVIK